MGTMEGVRLGRVIVIFVAAARTRTEFTYPDDG